LIMKGPTREDDPRLRSRALAAASLLVASGRIRDCGGDAGHRRRAVRADRGDHLPRRRRRRPSIAFIIGVAIGGRNTLIGPVLGAIVVAYAQTTLSEQFPAFWTYFQGATFMLVVAFLPGGIASIKSVIDRARTRSVPPLKPPGERAEPDAAPASANVPEKVSS
jgi:cytochrome c biogenesis protein CcdA